MKKYKHTKDLGALNKKPSFWKNKKMLVGLVLFIIAIMVGSVLLMSERGADSGRNIEYNGHKFIYNDQKGWTTTVNGKEVAFEMTPADLEGVKKESFFGMNFGKTYVTFNPAEFSENSYEVSRLLGFLAFTGRQAFPACSDEKGCGDLPVVNCSGNSTDSVVYLTIGNETQIKQEGNCLILESKPGDELKVISLFIYQLLGIVK